MPNNRTTAEPAGLLLSEYNNGTKGDRMGVMAGAQVADLIKRLHGGPLQAFFAGLIALELNDDSRDERLAVILGDGVAELQAIIGEIRDSPLAVFESATANFAATIDKAEATNSNSSRLEAYHQISQQLNNLGVVAARQDV